MYNPTTADEQTMREAAVVAAKMYEESLIRQFVRDDRHHLVLRPSALGKPAADLFARRFFPELYAGGIESINLQTRQLFHEGDTLEADLYFHLVRSGIPVLDTQPLIDWHGIRGHGDLVVELDGRRFLMEVKSAKDSFFKDVNRHGISDDSRGYLTQLAIYSDALSLPSAWLVYNKDTSAVTVIHPSPIDLERALARAKYLIDVWNKVDCWEDVFEFIRPNPPRKEFVAKKWTGRYMLPLPMWSSPARHLVYEIVEGKNAKGETREFILDYKYPEKFNHLKPHLEQPNVA